MEIDFDQLDLQKLESFKGGDKYFLANIFDDNKNKIMRGELVPGASIGLHRHIGNSEIIFIYKGVCTVVCDGEERQVAAGQCHYCPEGSEHSLANNSDSPLRFYAVVASA